MARGKSREKGLLLERQARALRLRMAGTPFRVIAAELGISVKTAHSDVMSALKAAAQYNEKVLGGEALTLELARLDEMLLAIAPQVRQGHLGAIDRALRIAERRAKLLGLDAPTRTRLNIDVTALSDEELEAIARGDFKHD